MDRNQQTNPMQQGFAPQPGMPVQPQMPPQAPMPPQKNGKPKRERKPTSPLTFVKWGVTLILFLIITNPSLLFFLPRELRNTLRNTWSGLFGDVTSIANGLIINWSTLFRVIAIILLMVTITSLVAFILDHVHPKSGKSRSFVTLIRSALGYITAIIGFFWCLASIGVNVSTIVAGVSIVTLGLSFGAQSLVQDVVTGLFLVFEDEFNVGDIIEVNGFRGTVESIGIRVTAIRGPGGNVKIINNSDLRNILNRSAATSIATTVVSVAYSEDVEKVEKVLSETFPLIRAKYPDVFLEDPKNFGVDCLNDSSVDFKIGASVNEKDIFSAPRILNREIKIAFDKAGVEIPFPQVVVHQGK